MSKFASFYNKDTGKRIAIDVFSVVDVVECEDCTEIYLDAVIGSTKNFSLTYVRVAESYDEVMFELNSEVK